MLGRFAVLLLVRGCAWPGWCVDCCAMLCCAVQVLQTMVLSGNAHSPSLDYINYVKNFKLDPVYASVSYCYCYCYMVQGKLEHREVPGASNLPGVLHWVGLCYCLMTCRHFPCPYT
jgi:hypothetical protein